LSLHPDEMERLRSNPLLERNAFEEILRYISSVHIKQMRMVLNDTVAGVEIPKRERVVPMLAAGNRDPRCFEDPNRLDVGR
jgi:cytochrome P450